MFVFPRSSFSGRKTLERQLDAYFQGPQKFSKTSFPIQGSNEGLQLSSVESHQVDDEHCH